jgi:hypothetical protein
LEFAKECLHNLEKPRGRCGRAPTPSHRSQRSVKIGGPLVVVAASVYVTRAWVEQASHQFGPVQPNRHCRHSDVGVLELGDPGHFARRLANHKFGPTVSRSGNGDDRVAVDPRLGGALAKQSLNRRRSFPLLHLLRITVAVPVVFTSKPQ